MKLLSVICLLVCVLKNEASVAILDADSLKNLDKYVRSEILNKILGELNATTIQQNVQSGACKLKVESSYTTCKTCFNDMCKQQQQQSSNIGHLDLGFLLNKLTPMIFKPQLLVGGMVDIIGNGLPAAIDLLGAGGKAFLGKVGHLANELGHTFKGASSLLSAISSPFEKLGTDLLSNAGSLLNQLTSGSLLLLANTGAGDLFQKVEHGAENLLHGLQSAGGVVTSVGQTIGNSIKNVGQTLGNTASNLFHSIFGRRSVKRCTTTCPVCSTIDLQQHTKEQVLIAVCGQPYVTNQAITVHYLNTLKQLYNTTLSLPLLSKVDYDPSSLSTNGGVGFSKSHFSFVNNGNPETLTTNTLFSISNLQATGKHIADQIWSYAQTK